MDKKVMNELRKYALNWVRGREEDEKIVNETFDSIINSSETNYGLEKELSTGAKLSVYTNYSVRIQVPESIQISRVSPNTLASMTSNLAPEQKALATKAVEELNAAHCMRFTIPLSHEIIIVDGNTFSKIVNI